MSRKLSACTKMLRVKPELLSGDASDFKSGEDVTYITDRGLTDMGRKIIVCICLAVSLFGSLSVSSLLPMADAGDRRDGFYPYGEFRRGYGEKRAVANSQEARRMLKDYFARRDVRIGDIRERELFFEADIRDRRGALVDKVIIDKRTGRIRSTY